jgi:urocanate hydratase
LDPAGSALSIAANIAGAVSLIIDNDLTHIREAIRAGAVDFTVTTLDEAIRAMKNEIRKGSPLSVALSADPVLALDDVLGRGLAPQLFASFLPTHSRIEDAAHTLATLGADLIDFTASPPAAGFQASGALVGPLLERHGWTLRIFTFETQAALRSFDARVLSLLPPEDVMRRRWIEAGRSILPRDASPNRALWLTQSEFDLFLTPMLPLP